MHNTNLLSDLLKSGRAWITLISRKKISGKFSCILPSNVSQTTEKWYVNTDTLKCILWDFDKKSGYFLYLLRIYINMIEGTRVQEFTQKKNVLQHNSYYM